MFTLDPWVAGPPPSPLECPSGPSFFSRVREARAGGRSMPARAPSFAASFDKDHLHEDRDSGRGMVRTELLCARCGSHHGPVFADGPPPTRLKGPRLAVLDAGFVGEARRP